MYVRILAEERTKGGTRVVVDNAGREHHHRFGLPPVVSFFGNRPTNSIMYDKLPHDPAKDFAPVSQMAYQPIVIAGRSELPYKRNGPWAKADPGKISAHFLQLRRSDRRAPSAAPGKAGICL